MIFEIVIVGVLILVNGALAMSELAVVSSRPARLQALAEAGNRGAASAQKLAADPGRFLSSVQIGITLVGVLSGAFSGATLGTRLADWLLTQGVPAAWAQSLGVGSVVVILTYLSLIVGELVPKQIALRNPEAVSARVAPAMTLVAMIGAPVVWVLDVSGKAVLALLGQTAEGKSRVTEEEVRLVLAEAHGEGVIETEEQEMLSGVMRLADRSARALMTPRRDVDMLDAEATTAETLAAIVRIGRPRIPVQQRDGEVLGVLYVTDAFAALAAGQPLDLASLVREVPVVSDMADALDVVEILRGSTNHMALVYDEYGSFEGIITTGDILEAITGAFREHAAEEPAILTRDDGSYLVSGWMPADEFRDRLNLPRDADAGDYDTVAGLVIDHLRRLPALGDSFVLHGWRFEIVDMDDRRIDKLLVSRAAAGSVT